MQLSFRLDKRPGESHLALDGKNACSFLQVSQSGSKSKLWSRIVATLDKQLILEEKELSDLALQESTEPARPVHSAQPPSEEEIRCIETA